MINNNNNDDNTLVCQMLGAYRCVLTQFEKRQRASASQTLSCMLRAYADRASATDALASMDILLPAQPSLNNSTTRVVDKQLHIVQ